MTGGAEPVDARGAAGRTAWLCPGQGMEQPGAWSGPLLELASELTGVDLPRALRTGDRALLDTAVAQPALVAVTLSCAPAGRPDVLAGHSLGELTAWALAGGASPEDAVRLATVRGRAMAEAARRHPGGMRAVRHADLPTVLPPGLVLAVDNPDGVVLSGDHAALRALTLGTPVATGGAWHSPAMAEARGPFAAALDALPRRGLHTRLILCDGHEARDDAHARQGLVDRITGPVRWTEALRRLDAEVVVILGPAKVLRHHLRVARDRKSVV